jgi:predicted dienelactone hydrolase
MQHAARSALSALALAGALSCALPARAAGFQYVFAADPQGKPIEAGIWYPSAAKPLPHPLDLYTQTVAVDAPVAGKALPLVVISNATGGSYASQYDTALALADAGFVVAALTHTTDNGDDASGALDLMDRPRQVERLIDYMLDVWPDRGHVDPARIGIFGFDAGGFTALVDVGGEPDLPLIAEHCRQHPAEPTCELLAKRAGASVKAPVIAYRRVRDARIKAAVVAAPSYGFTFSAASLKNVTVPVQLWRAADDSVLPSPFYVEPVLDALPNTPEYTVVRGADHDDFLAPCSAALAKASPNLCVEHGGFDRTAFHKTFDAAVVSFFEKTLAAK